MRALARTAAVALFTIGVSFALASIASGQTAGARSPSAEAAAKKVHLRSKGKSKTKKKHKARRTTAPRGSARLSFAAAGDEVLVDESALPPPRSGACPPEMVTIEGRYCVDKWEGSLVEMSASGDAIFPFTSTLDGRAVRAVSVPGVFPQGYISGAEASQACSNAGKRLCTPMEWRKACVGPRTLQFGYGDARESGRCNDHGRSPMREIWGTTSESPRADWSPLKMNDARLNALAGSLARTGDHSDCTNEYGVFDMVGNLHEWTSDPDGTFQGGYYLDTTINGDGCAYRTTAHDFGYHDYSTGFRCCADPR
jgi:hypothetical protein